MLMGRGFVNIYMYVGVVLSIHRQFYCNCTCRVCHIAVRLCSAWIEAFINVSIRLTMSLCPTQIREED
jgi:hypothetical protein